MCMEYTAHKKKKKMWDSPASSWPLLHALPRGAAGPPSACGGWGPRASQARSTARGTGKGPGPEPAEGTGTSTARHRKAQGEAGKGTSDCLRTSLGQ